MNRTIHSSTYVHEMDIQMYVSVNFLVWTSQKLFSSTYMFGEQFLPTYYFTNILPPTSPLYESSMLVKGPYAMDHLVSSMIDFWNRKPRQLFVNVLKRRSFLKQIERHHTKLPLLGYYRLTFWIWTFSSFYSIYSCSENPLNSHLNG